MPDVLCMTHCVPAGVSIESHFTTAVYVLPNSGYLGLVLALILFQNGDLQKGTLLLETYQPKVDRLACLVKVGVTIYDLV